jgi:hypothetical protein
MSYDKQYKEATGRNLKHDVNVAFSEHFRLFKACQHKRLPGDLALAAWHAGLNVESLFEITYKAKAEGFDVETYIRNLPRIKEMPLVRANIIDVNEEN